MSRKRYERTLVHALTGETLGYVFDTSLPENVFDPEGGRWVAICHQHSTLMNTTTLTDALALVASREFCEACEEARA